MCVLKGNKSVSIGVCVSFFKAPIETDLFTLKTHTNAHFHTPTPISQRLARVCARMCVVSMLVLWASKEIGVLAVVY